MNFKNYTNHIWVDIFKEKILSWQYILIDMRTMQEQIERGIIEHTSVSIDVYQADVQEKLSALDINKKYLLYCWHGVRSAQALDILKDKGCEEVYDLIWWTDLWEKQWNILVKK